MSLREFQSLYPPHMFVYLNRGMTSSANAGRSHKRWCHATTLGKLLGASAAIPKPSLPTSRLAWMVQSGQVSLYYLSSADDVGLIVTPMAHLDSAGDVPKAEAIAA